MFVSSLAVLPTAVANAATTTSLPTWSAPVLVDHQAPFADANLIQGVSCLTGGECFAVDNAGRVLTSSDPTGGATAWQVSASLYSQALAEQNNLAGVPSLSPGFYQPVGISCPSALLCVAVGQDAQVAVSTDPTGGASAWTVSNLNSASAFNGDQLTSVSCPTVSLCVAAGSNPSGGIVFTTTDPTGGPSAWTLAQVDTATTASSVTTLTGVSCTAALCVAVDNDGNVVTSGDPTGGASAWTLSGVDGTNQMTSVSCNPALCVATDQNGNVITATVTAGVLSAWTVTSLVAPINGGNAPGVGVLAAVSCPSSSLCTVVESQGAIVASTNPTGGEAAWSQVYVEGYTSTGPVTVTNINAVSCTTGSLCVAVGAGDYAFASSDPTGGQSAWTENVVDGYTSLRAVSCPSTTLCVGVDDAGNIVTSTDPITAGATWSITRENDPFTSISCPSTTLCVAAGGYNIFTSTDPAGGPSAWSATQLPTSNGGLFDVSCPSTTLCVGSGLFGGLIVSTDPTGGANSWTETRSTVLSAFGEKFVSCPSTGFCVAVSQLSGAEFYSTDPAGGVWQPSSNPYSVEQASGNKNAITGLDCPSATLCLAIDDEGNLYSSTNPTGGAAQWIGVNLDGTTMLDNVTCDTNGGLLCLIGDSAGHIFASENPSGGSWSAATNIDGSNIIDGVSCGATYMCVAVDNMGYAVATSAISGLAVDIQSVAAGISGTVVSTPAGISCPGTCSYPFAAGQTVTLTATANSASLFGGFTGCTASTVNPLGASCTLTTQAGQNTVDVYFTEVSASVTVSNAVKQNGGNTVNTTIDGCGSSGAVDYYWSIDGTAYTPAGSPTACSFNYPFADGPHTIGLTATDASGTRKSIVTDDISTSPLAGFTWIEQLVPYGDSPSTVKVTFDACTQSAGLDNYSWNFGGAAPAQEGPGCEVTAVLPVTTSQNTTVTLTGTGFSPLPGGLAPTVTVTGSVDVTAEQSAPTTGCQVASVGPDACWRLGAGAFGVPIGGPARAPDFVVVALSANVGAASVGIGAVLTCDGSVYVSPSFGLGVSVGLPASAVLGWGYASDLSNPIPPTNSQIDNFVQGAWVNFGLNAGIVGIQYIDSSGAIGYEYDTGAVDTVGVQISGSYGKLSQPGDGAALCTDGVTASPAFQQMMNVAQFVPAPTQQTIDFTGTPNTGSSLQVGAGSQVVVQSTGWQDGTTVTVTAADPVQLATQASSDTGSSSIDVTIPPDLPAGPTTITETGIAPDGSLRTLTRAITVTAPPPTPTTQGKASTTTISVSPTSTGLYGQVTYNATVSGSDGTLTGTVVFTTGPTTLCTATLSAATGTASCVATNAPAGPDSITGTYSGDSTYAVSTGSATLNVGPTTAGSAYYETASDGGVFAFDAPFYGSMGGKKLNAPVVGIAADPATGGYWEVASDGGVFAFDAPFYGSMGGKKLNAPVVGMAATPDGGGYWLVAADGEVFPFGNAKFQGSMGGKKLNAPVVGIAADPATGGYWEVASDGGVFAFDTPFYGSMGGKKLNAPVVGMAAT